MNIRTAKYFRAPDQFFLSQLKGPAPTTNPDRGGWHRWRHLKFKGEGAKLNLVCEYGHVYW